MTQALLTMKEVVIFTGLSRASVYRRVRDGSFPKPVQVGPRCVRFRREEVENWLEGLSPVSGS